MPTILPQSIINSITSKISTIIGDDNISTNVVYRQTGTTVSTWDPTTGTIPAMYTESAVSAFKGGYSVDEIEESGGLIEYEDVKFIIMASDVSGVLTVDDQIREPAIANIQSSTTYSIKAVSRDPLNICYFIRTRKGGVKNL